MRDLAYKALQFKERFNKEKGREPSIEEIAKELGVQKEEIAFSFLRASAMVILSAQLSSLFFTSFT